VIAKQKRIYNGYKKAGDEPAFSIFVSGIWMT
jgi:hypothetical protein